MSRFLSGIRQQPARRHDPILSLCAIFCLFLVGCGGGGEATTTSARGQAKAKQRSAGPRDVGWPIFGRLPERTHYLAQAPDPPFHMLWQFFAHQLIEFPPAVNHGVLYVVNKVGQVYAVRATDGKVLWRKKVDDDVTGPAYAHGTVYLAQLKGLFAAVEASSGKVRWTYDPHARLESSPLVIAGRVYFGDDDGVLWALDARTGKVEWKVDLGPAIKASPSYHDGVVYVGDYSGGVDAVSAHSGHRQWQVDTSKLPGGGDAGFYASPSIGFGHVYDANVDGTVYAFSLAGHPDWHFQAGDGVYGSPALAGVKGAGPTTFIGSYDHRLYALNAQTGARRWSYDVGGQIPGSPTVIGSTVYTSSFQTRKTTGLDARSGKPVFHWGSAGYDPMISDGKRAFLSGFQTVWAFEAKHPENGH